MNSSIRPPRRYRRLVARVMHRDAGVIARHPGGARAIRVYVPGEAWPLHRDTWTHVLVSPIAPGVRFRTFGRLANGTFAGDDIEIVDQDDPTMPGRIVPPDGVELLGIVDCREGVGR